MAITIRNKETEALIRELGKPRGEGPSATIARIAREAKEREEEAWAKIRDKRLKAARDLYKLIPPLTDDDKRAIDSAMEDMWDENGLPK
jgi:hypothetical protein